MSKRNILIIAVFATGLSGCSTLQKLNPFGHKTKTAPCKAMVASNGPVSLECEGKTINLDFTVPDELLKLRGPIDIETGRAYGIIEAAP